MSRWQLDGGGSDEEMQEAQTPYHDNHDNIQDTIAALDNITIPLLRTDIEANIDGEWNLSTPNIQPPHNDYPINAKELSLLMPKTQYDKYLKMLFESEEVRESNGFKSGKFTASSMSHPKALQNWKKRYVEHLPAKEGVKLSSVYSPFMRCIIAEFILGWKVDYKWKTKDDKFIDLPVHPRVLEISDAMKGKGKMTQGPTQTKGKRKIEDVEIDDSLPTGNPMVKKEAPFFPMVKKEGDAIRLDSHFIRKNAISTIPQRSTFPSSDTVHTIDEDSVDIHNVCQIVGLEVAELIEKSLRSKFNVVLVESETFNDYKFKLHSAESQIKDLQRNANSSANEDVVKDLKVQLYDKSEEIRRLSALVRHDTSSEHARFAAMEKKLKRFEDELVEKNMIINTLQHEADPYSGVIAQINSYARKEGEDGDGFMQMKIVDPTVRSTLFPSDEEGDYDKLDALFKGWSENTSLARHVQGKGSVCQWCQYPFGPESVSLLGTCGHMWHHACLLHWMKTSRRCFCRMPFHDREYEQRGLLQHMPPFETQPNTEFESEFTEPDTLLDTTPIEHFTINEHNLSDGEFEQLIRSNRWNEWKQHALDNQPSLDERKLARSIRAHRRRQAMRERDASTSNV